MRIRADVKMDFRETNVLISRSKTFHVGNIDF